MSKYLLIAAITDVLTSLSLTITLEFFTTLNVALNVGSALAPNIGLNLAGL